jgi:hypothetical protein
MITVTGFSSLMILCYAVSIFDLQQPFLLLQDEDK